MMVHEWIERDIAEMIAQTRLVVAWPAIPEHINNTACLFNAVILPLT